MKRLAAILLALCFLALGSGGLEYVHNLQHAAEDAIEDAEAAAAGHPIEHHHHDETNCHVHAQLHIALFFSAWASSLPFLGLLILSLSLICVLPIRRVALVRIQCRGPPFA